MKYLEYVYKLPRGSIYAWAEKLGKTLGLKKYTPLKWRYNKKNIPVIYWKKIVQFSKTDKLVKGQITMRDLDQVYGK
jgi:hypothetical protein